MARERLDSESIDEQILSLLIPGNRAEGEHLSDDTLRHMALESPEQCAPVSTEKADLHLEACSECRARYLEFADDQPPVGVGGASDRAPLPPVVILIGRPDEDLRSIAFEMGGPAMMKVLEGAISAVRADLSRGLSVPLAAAEALANKLTENRYDLWKARFGVSTPEAAAEALATTSNENRRSTSEPEEYAFPALAAGDTIEVTPTSGSYRGHPDYVLSLSGGSSKEGPATTLTLTAPAKRKELTWGYRFEFAPEAQAMVFEELGFDRSQLGLLRVLVGEQRWRSLLDTLLPQRYGISGDKIFGRGTVGNSVPGSLPGAPSAVKFWLG